MPAYRCFTQANSAEVAVSRLSLAVIYATVALDAARIGLLFPILPRLIQDVTQTPLTGCHDPALWIALIGARPTPNRAASSKRLNLQIKPGCLLKSGAKMSDRNSLTTIASSARSFLETVWPDWQLEQQQRFGYPMPAIMSYSTCARSSTFVKKIMDDLGVAGEVRHGWFRAAKSDSSWALEERHAWVASGSWFVDVTADQFGADEIIVTSKSDDRYCSDIDVALPEFQLRRIQSVSEIWGLWIHSPMREKLLADLRPQWGGATLGALAP